MQQAEEKATEYNDYYTNTFASSGKKNKFITKQHKNNAGPRFTVYSLKI